jgi:flagellar hook protein FlgE
MSLFSAIGSAISGHTGPSSAFANVTQDIASSQTIGFKRVSRTVVNCLIGVNNSMVPYKSQQFYAWAGDFMMNSTGSPVNNAGQSLYGRPIDPEWRGKSGDRIDRGIQRRYCHRVLHSHPDAASLIVEREGGHGSQLNAAGSTADSRLMPEHDP